MPTPSVTQDTPTDHRCRYCGSDADTGYRRITDTHYEWMCWNLSACSARQDAEAASVAVLLDDITSSRAGYERWCRDGDVCSARVEAQAMAQRWTITAAGCAALQQAAMTAVA